MATPTAAMIAEVRRKVAEPTTTTYSDALLTSIIEVYPLPDANGLEPDDTLWAGAWDLNRAAADVWDEKAATVAADFDFAADGGDYKRSQLYTQYVQSARRYRAMRQTGALELIAHPRPLGAVRLNGWIGNLPEIDEYNGVE